MNRFLRIFFEGLTIMLAALGMFYGAIALIYLIWR